MIIVSYLSALVISSFNQEAEGSGVLAYILVGTQRSKGVGLESSHFHILDACSLGAPSDRQILVIDGKTAALCWDNTI